jgi:hypothetical protein
MKLFFSIDPGVKHTIISRIKDFQSQYFHKHTQIQDEIISESGDPSSPGSKARAKRQLDSKDGNMRAKSSSKTFNGMFGQLRKSNASKLKAQKEQPATPTKLQVP